MAKKFSKNLFLGKSSTFCIFQTTRFGSKFTPCVWSKYVSINVLRDFRLPASAFATVAQKSFNDKFAAKIDFLDRAFCLTNTDADIESLTSLHTLFNKYLNHMPVKFEQNRMILNILNLELFGKKWLIIFLRKC